MLKILFLLTMVYSTQGVTLDAAGQQQSMSVTPKATMRKAAPKILDALSEDVTQPLADKDPLMENAWGTAFAEETQQHQRINVSSEDIDLKLNQGMSFAEETQQHQRINVSSGDIDLKLNQSLHQLPIQLSNEEHIYLQSHDHDTYVGMCGNQYDCGGDRYGIFGYPTREVRTKWTVEIDGAIVSLKNVHGEHTGYLGVCSCATHGCAGATNPYATEHGSSACDGASVGTFAYTSKDTTYKRTEWLMEAAPCGNGPCIYLKQPHGHGQDKHDVYLGFCGNKKNTCGASVHGVLGFPTKTPPQSPGRTLLRVLNAQGNPVPLSTGR